MTSPAHPARPARPPVTRVPGPRRGTAGTPGPAPEVAGPGSPRSALGGAGRYATWVLLLAAGHLLLARAGRVIPLPEVHDARTVLDGLVGTAPDVVAFSALRVLAGALLWYLTGLTVLGTLARVTGLPALLRLTRGLAGPGTRRLLQQAIGLGLGMSVTVPVATLGVVDGRGPRPPDPVVTMHVLDDPPAIAVAPGVARPGPQADPRPPSPWCCSSRCRPTPPGPRTRPRSLGPGCRPWPRRARSPGCDDGHHRAGRRRGRSCRRRAIEHPGARGPRRRVARDRPRLRSDRGHGGPGGSRAGVLHRRAGGRTRPGRRRGRSRRSRVPGDLAADRRRGRSRPATTSGTWRRRPSPAPSTTDPTTPRSPCTGEALIDANDRLVVAGEPDLVLPGQVFALPPLPRR
jgi:hypothetical protein